MAGDAEVSELEDSVAGEDTDLDDAKQQLESYRPLSHDGRGGTGSRSAIGGCSVQSRSNCKWLCMT